METIQQNTHLSEELIELYVQGRMAAMQASEVSDHLFECDQCYERYELAAEFQIAFREAAPQLQTAEPEQQEPWWKMFAWPAPVWAATAAALILLFAVIPMLRQPGAPVVAELTAIRSGDTVKVKAGHPVELRLDTTGVEAAPQVKTEIVDSSGHKIWDGQSKLQNGRWEAFVNKQLTAGRYWVRVYQSAAAEPIREYSLVVE